MLQYQDAFLPEYGQPQLDGLYKARLLNEFGLHGRREQQDKPAEAPQVEAPTGTWLRLLSGYQKDTMPGFLINGDGRQQ